MYMYMYVCRYVFIVVHVHTCMYIHVHVVGGAAISERGSTTSSDQFVSGERCSGEFSPSAADTQHTPLLPELW